MTAAPTPPRPDDAAIAADIVFITQLLSRIALLADEGDLDDYARCFTPDAVWRVPAIASTGVAAAEVVGRGAIIEAARIRRADGIQGPGSAARHIVTGHVVTVHGNQARAKSYFRFYTRTTTVPQLSVLGTYSDLLERCDGDWLLTDRTIEIG